jgi:membrane-bound lytic murein transglycosylase A
MRAAVARLAALLLPAAMVLAACAGRGPAGPSPDAVGYEALPGWREDRHAEALPALRESCRRMAALGPSAPLGGMNGAPELARGSTPAAWAPVCAAAATVADNDHAAARALFETYLEPHPLSPGPDGRALFTGYYEPISPGARQRGGIYQTPIHRRPANLTQTASGPDPTGRRLQQRGRGGRVGPVPDRAAILAGAYRGRGLELAWLADPVDAFFLQVQGSGRILLPDGEQMRVGFAGTNGRPYVAIGKILIDRGEISREEMSMQAIRAWLKAHPDQADRLMNANPSYVFFREVHDIPPDQGARGAFGVPLTPGRSLAVDRAFIPLGVPVFIATEDPVDGTPYRRLLLAQDTGGAIKGAVRADIFYGWGAEAEKRAGLMKGTGEAWVLLPRAQPSP